jgi:hypothetical protein
MNECNSGCGADCGVICPPGAPGATGATGPGGGNTSEIPPAVIFGPTISTATSAYISWEYPPQTPAGFMPGYLPFIVSFSSNLVSTIGAVDIQTNNTSTGVNQYINNNGVGSIVGLILTNDSTYVGNPVQTLTFPTVPTTGPFIAQYKYISNLRDLLADGNSKVYAWYKNYNPNYNSNNLTISALINAGAPTAPRNLYLVSYAGDNVDPQYFTIGWTAPQYSDSINNTNTIAIKNYIVQYSNPGSFISLSPVSQSLQTSDTITNVLQKLLNPVYPDCVYTTNVYAYNTANITPGSTSSSLLVTSNCIPRLASSTLVPTFTVIPNPSLTGYLVSDTNASVLKSGITTSTTPLVTDIITFAISFKETRGNLGSSSTLTTLTTSISNVVTTLSGPTLAANNTGLTLTNNPLNNLNITTSNFVDSYNLSFNYNKGFYYQGLLALTSSSFVATPNPITLSINQVYNTIPAPVGSSSSTSSFSFYYDSTTGNPTNSLYSLNLATGFFRQISGIWVLYGTSTYTISGSTDNLGNYFYKNPMLTYTITTSASEIILNSQTSGTNQVSSGIIGGNKFSTTVTFSTSQSASAPLQFANNLVLSVTPRNINGTGSSASSSNAVIIDTKTNLSNRIENANIGSTSVLNSSYDDTQSILGTTDLQCVDGKVCTKITNVSYLDYRPYWYYNGSVFKNTLNYSSITSGTRYVTVRSQYTPRVNPYTTIQLIISGSGFSSLTGFTSIYYRSIDITQSTPVDGSDNISSYWVNGLPGSTGTQLTGSNYANPSLSLIGWYYDITSTSSQISGYLNFPGGTSITGSLDYYFYLQIGLDISVQNIRISSIQIIIS